MDITRAIQTSDYDNDERRAELNWLAEKAHQRNCIVEVGSWKGTTAIAMATNTSGQVFVVDTFKGSKNEEAHQRLDEKPEDWLFNTFCQNTAGIQNLSIMRMTSIEAAEYSKTVGRKYDMIFLDASHDYDSVKEDILAWMPLLSPEGLLCGHDRTWDGVSRAVNELVLRPAAGSGAIWYAR